MFGRKIKIFQLTLQKKTKEILFITKSTEYHLRLCINIRLTRNANFAYWQVTGCENDDSENSDEWRKYRF